jgi:hypothetical protein
VNHWGKYTFIVLIALGMGATTLLGCGETEVEAPKNIIQDQDTRFDSLPNASSVPTGSIESEILIARILANETGRLLIKNQSIPAGQRESRLDLESWFAVGDEIANIDQVIRFIVAKSNPQALSAFRSFRDSSGVNFRNLYVLAGLGRTNNFTEVSRFEKKFADLTLSGIKGLRGYSDLERLDHLTFSVDLAFRASDLLSALNATAFQVARALRMRQNGQNSLSDQLLCFRLGFSAGKTFSMERMVIGQNRQSGSSSTRVLDAFQKASHSALQLESVCKNVPIENRVREMRTAMGRLVTDASAAQSVLNGWQH